MFTIKTDDLTHPAVQALVAIHYFRIASMTKIDCVDQVDNQQTVRNQRNHDSNKVDGRP